MHSRILLVASLALLHFARSQIIVGSQAEADYAIVSTRVPLYDMEDADPGGNYELWGNFRVLYGDFIMARTNIGTSKRHIICNKGSVGGPRDWAGDIAIAAAAVGAGIATGGTGTAGIAAGAAVSVVSQVMLQAKENAEDCTRGYVATASYPVKIGANTLHYNYVLDMREDDSTSADEVWQLYTRQGLKNWSDIDECWGELFDPGSHKTSKSYDSVRVPYQSLPPSQRRRLSLSA